MYTYLQVYIYMYTSPPHTMLHATIMTHSKGRASLSLSLSLSLSTLTHTLANPHTRTHTHPHTHPHPHTHLHHITVWHATMTTHSRGRACLTKADFLTTSTGRTLRRPETPRTVRIEEGVRERCCCWRGLQPA